MAALEWLRSSAGPGDAAPPETANRGDAIAAYEWLLDGQFSGEQFLEEQLES